MKDMLRRDYSRGWTPSSDAVNGIKNGLLRADNLILDDLGILALRKGSSILTGPLADTDIHSLFTVYINGTRYRMVGAAAQVYANGASLSQSFAGSGDISFGSDLGQIFMARGSTKKKYDGASVRNWGLAKPTGAATLAAIAPDYKVFASCDSGESPGFAADEGTVLQADGYDDVANNAIQLTADADTARGTATKDFGADTNFNQYVGGAGGIDQDLIEFYAYITDPAAIESISLMIDVGAASAASFATDYYFYEFRNYEEIEVSLHAAEFLAADFSAEGWERADIRDRIETRPSMVTTFRRDKPTGNVGWNKFSVPRVKMARIGGTTGRDWSTVRRVRVTFKSNTATEAIVRFDDIRIVGGDVRPLTGSYRYRVVPVYNPNAYQAKGTPSDASSLIQLKTSGCRVTVPSAMVSSIDTQCNELWIYRMGGYLDAYYRVFVKTGGPFSGDQVIDDVMSDRDAMRINLKLERDNVPPPDNIIGIAADHYFRTLVLSTTHLYPSRRLDPESFPSGQALKVADADETCYWLKKTTGAVFVGTSKDIYAIEGDGAENPDGTINFSLKPMNIGSPPISRAVASEGNLIVYLSSDGWRIFAGVSSELFVGDTHLLWTGHSWDRHGVSYINVGNLTARFSAAISKGIFTAVTPESTETVGSARLHRYNIAQQRWYRHTYTPTWRTVYREPDGTLIAGDYSGRVWQLDVGNQDNSVDIPVVMWTIQDDDDTPNNRKDAFDYEACLDTYTNPVSIALHLDGSESAAATLTTTTPGSGVYKTAINTLSPFRRIQQRITGNFSTFKWLWSRITYEPRPEILNFVNTKPNGVSSRRRRFGGLSLQIDTLGGAAVITPVLDGADQTTFQVTTSLPLRNNLAFSTVIGFDLWAKISKSTGFELYAIEPMVTEELPQRFRGRVPNSNFGYAGTKVLSGLQFRVCTLGASRTFTPILDGVNQATFNLETGVEPETYLYKLTGQQSAIEIAFSVDGEIELYDFKPMVLYTLPLPRRVWDLGEIDIGTRDLVWLREIRLKVRADASLTVTPYFDDTAKAARTVTVIAGKTVVYSVPFGRENKGRQPRIIVTSASDFIPWWAECIFRASGNVTEKSQVRIGAS